MKPLQRAHRWWVFDWDGTAVSSRQADASQLVRALGEYLRRGGRASIVTGTKVENVLHQLGEGFPPRDCADWGRLLVSTNRGSEVWGFDRRAEPRLCWSRVASAVELRQLDAAAEALVAALEQRTGLEFRIEYARLNRRKVDLLPEPAWADPPKSELPALVRATELRLASRGWTGGLAEVVREAERLSRQQGLLEPRITTDGKHVEIGLTDKADALPVLWAEVGEPLHLHPEEVLIVGDELGPIGGVPGSDARMGSFPQLRGAEVLSLGPEPEGVPPGVTHLGGGPALFLELLHRELALLRVQDPLTPPLDPAWTLEVRGFHPEQEPELESRFTLANGRVGSRGSLAEGSRSSRPCTLLAGAFELSADVTRVPELLVLPEWGRLRLRLGGRPLSLEEGSFARHRRVLDLRRGLLLREDEVDEGGAPGLCLRHLRAASLAERSLMLSTLEVRAPREGEREPGRQGEGGAESAGEGWRLEVELQLSTEVRSASGAQPWVAFERREEQGALLLEGRTHGGRVVALSARSEATPPLERVRIEAPTSPELPASSAEGRIRELYQGTLRPGEACRLEARLQVESSGPGGRPAAPPQVSQEEALRKHELAWAERWRRAGVELDGHPRLQRALRFATYHMIASANPEDPSTSIGARGLAGETYRGHVFWDTESFLSPFYRWTWPEAARAQLLYRHRTLPGALRKARSLGYEGALYAWESADTGEEATPSYVVTPFGELLRVLSGEQEHHISADVAQAVWAYVRTTGEVSLLEEGGFEILLETARFWASRVSWREGTAHIDRVIGPDEYHEGVDDNAFTNWMARHNLRAVVDASALAPRASQLLRPGELERFSRLAELLALGLDPTTGLIEQFKGYHQLELIDLESLEPRSTPADVVLGRGRTQASQVVKQADVVQLLALLWDEVPEASRLVNYLHYVSRTAHGSSLSPGVHALVAARLGLVEQAVRFLEKTARIDLEDSFGNTAGGVHVAAFGALWQAVVFGLAGVSPSPGQPEVLTFEPHLAPGLRALRVPLTFRGASLEALIEPDRLEVEVGEGAGLRLGLPGAGSTRALWARPGSVHRCLGRGSPDARWETVRQGS